MTKIDPARVLAIDPGGEHVGIASFEECFDTLGESQAGTGWRCIAAVEKPPVDAMWWVHANLNRFDVMVIEEFRLYPQMANTLIGSSMETSQLIGALHWEAERRNFDRDPGDRLQIAMQPADFKNTATGLLRSKKMKSTAKTAKTGGHALDAELHGWGYLFKTGLVK